MRYGLWGSWIGDAVTMAPSIPSFDRINPPSLRPSADIIGYIHLNEGTSAGDIVNSGRPFHAASS